MILELAILDVQPGETDAFEAAFQEAQTIISSMPGYGGHQLQKCIEKDNRYVLLVTWQTLEDHTQGFRKSDEYQQWKALLHHFYEPFPTVAHYQLVAGNKRLES